MNIGFTNMDWQCPAIQDMIANAEKEIPAFDNAQGPELTDTTPASESPITVKKFPWWILIAASVVYYGNK